MSAQSLQHVVCRGVIDHEFMTLFARSPGEAVAGFDLSSDERAMLLGLHARTLTELAEGVEAWRRGAVVSQQPVRVGSGLRQAAMAG